MSDSDITMEALAITGRTLIGPDKEIPHKRGNCFSVMVSGGTEYRIINFNAENLEELIKRGLTWPVQIKVVQDYRAVIHDPRISDKWYNDRICTVCAPASLLNFTQQLEQQRAVASGSRSEHSDWVILKRPDISQL